MIARGPHLPLGCDNIIVERLADDLSARLRIPRVPTIPFGVHSSRDPEAPGSTALTRKTLHRMMNELIEGWESEAKVRQVFILTTHAADAHLEALSTIRSVGQVTLIDIYAAPLPDALRNVLPDTALLMWLAPELIDHSQLPRTVGDLADTGRQLYQVLLDFAATQIRPVPPIPNAGPRLPDAGMPIPTSGQRDLPSRPDRTV